MKRVRGRHGCGGVEADVDPSPCPVRSGSRTDRRGGVALDDTRSSLYGSEARLPTSRCVRGTTRVDTVGRSGAFRQTSVDPWGCHLWHRYPDSGWTGPPDCGSRYR